MAKGDPRDTVPSDVQNEPLHLFGSIANMKRRLRLEDVSYADLRKAVQGETVRIHVADAVTDAWRAWKRQYLLGALNGREFRTFDVLPTETEPQIFRDYA